MSQILEMTRTQNGRARCLSLHGTVPALLPRRPLPGLRRTSQALPRLKRGVETIDLSFRLRKCCSHFNHLADRCACVRRQCIICMRSVRSHEECLLKVDKAPDVAEASDDGSEESSLDKGRPAGAARRSPTLLFSGSLNQSSTIGSR